MTFEVRWTPRARSDLDMLGETAGARIARKVAWFCRQNDPLSHAKALGGSYEGISRFRVGDYRVLFRIEHGQVRVLIVLRVKHRKNVYE